MPDVYMYLHVHTLKKLIKKRRRKVVVFKEKEIHMFKVSVVRF